MSLTQIGPSFPATESQEFDINASLMSSNEKSLDIDNFANLSIYETSKVKKTHMTNNDLFNTNSQGKATFQSRDRSPRDNKLLIMDNEDSLYAGDSMLQTDPYEADLTEETHDMQGIAQSFFDGKTENSSVYLKSEQVFLNHLRQAKRNGHLTRDQMRQLRQEAKQLNCIRSDR